MLCNMWWECTQWSWGNEVERNRVVIRICMLTQDSTLPWLKMKFHSNLLLSMTLTNAINLVGQMTHWGTSKLSFVSGKLFTHPQPLQINQIYKLFKPTTDIRPQARINMLLCKFSQLRGKVYLNFQNVFSTFTWLHFLLCNNICRISTDEPQLLFL